jgi:hypothetical protein
MGRVPLFRQNTGHHSDGANPHAIHNPAMLSVIFYGFFYGDYIRAGESGRGKPNNQFVREFRGYCVNGNSTM